MSRISELLIIKKRSRKIKKFKVKALGGCPQKRGVCLKVFKMSPRKPNSARRSVVKISLYNKRRLIAFIPGMGHNLQKFNDVLIRGGRAKDLPGIRYTLIRGKLDLYGADRVHARSKYGVIHPNK
jgi:small subunit ribosomal protein S12